LGKASRAERMEFSRRMEAARLERNEQNDKKIRRGWLYGAEDFIGDLIDKFEGEVREHHRGEERAMTEEEIAHRIVTAGMRELGWTEEDLRRRRKSDGGKVRLARAVRDRTAVDLKWIARRLQMGSWTHVSNLLQRQKCQK
jgi:hypothetical protein